MKCSTLLRNQKYKTEESKASYTQSLLKNYIFNSVLFTRSTNVDQDSSLQGSVDIFHHLCCNKLVSN